MTVTDSGGGCLDYDGNPLRAVYCCVGVVNYPLRLVGPTPWDRWVDFHSPSLGWLKVTHPDLVAHFDRGMEVGPWLDWAAELVPEVQPYADLYGRLAAGAAR